MRGASDDPVELRHEVPLAELTTLGVGGAARHLGRCRDAGELGRLLAWARERRLETYVLGGGSNLLVADRGFDGLCVQLLDRTIELAPAEDGTVAVRAGAGVGWDALVARTVAEGLAGLECLSGIPGWVGAAPIQNVGAYGQEVSETLSAVEVVELANGEVSILSAEQCGFGYRWSHFKGPWWGRYAVTAVELRLPRRPWGAVRYGDLERRFGAPREGSGPPLAEVRQAVLEIRRGKSMVLDPEDPNRRSAGSFFLNPLLTASEAEAVRRRARGCERRMPEYPAAGGRIKLSAAWLIEQAGFERGLRRGRAGLSSRHTLALVNLGGATAEELLALAREIRAGVRERFGVTLEPEPRFLGFGKTPEELLESP